MAKLEMNISAQEYSDKIQALTNHIGKLDGILTNYKAQEARLNSFVGEQDSNFENLRQNVLANIDAAKRAYTTAMNSKKILEQEMKEMEEKSTGMGKTIIEAKDKVSSVASAKIPVNELLDN